MKKIRLIVTVLFLSFSAFSFGQSRCDCDGLIGSCSITCGPGAVATCDGTWYGGCKCSCKEIVVPDPIGGILDLEEIETLREFLENPSAIHKLDAILADLRTLEIADNQVYVKEQEIYDKYFDLLSEIYLTLTEEKQIEFNYKVS